MAKVEMYKTQFCGYCTHALRLLNSKGVDVEEIDALAVQQPQGMGAVSAKLGFIHLDFRHGIDLSAFILPLK